MSGRLERLQRAVVEHAIDTVECGLGDLHGQLRGKRLTVEYFLRVAEEGFGMGDGVFSFDHESAVAETSFTSPAGGYPDMRVRPLLDTFRPIPWRPGAAAVLCEALTPHERQPLPVCPRQALRRLLDEAAGEGWQFMAAAEVECYLLNADRAPPQPGGRCYALSPGTIEPVLRDLRQGLCDFGLEVEATHLEFGAGQVEINLRPASALAAADRALYLKAAVKELAARHGLLATFMAKPWQDQPGSGMHLHLSLASERDNVFGAEGADSPRLEHSVAGLLAHLPGLTFLSSTTVNGFKRLVEHSFAPTNATWGGDNRTTAVRVLGRGDERRLEYRGGAADANPYLLLAGCVAAALDGLRRRLPAPRPTEGDAYALGATLPRSLAEAVAAFEADTPLRQALGPILSRHLLEMARREWRLFLEAVTDWERERYLELA